MKKYTTVFWTDIEKRFNPSPGLQLLIKGKVYSNINNSFAKKDIKSWIEELQKNDDHPMFEELIILQTFLQANRIHIVLV